MTQLVDDIEVEKAHFKSCLRREIAELERNIALESPSNAESKQISISDPPIFYGNKDEMAVWLREMKLKLIANADSSQMKRQSCTISIIALKERLDLSSCLISAQRVRSTI